jgi:arylsulfatase
MPWQVPVPADPEHDTWRLYDLNADFAAREDLAKEFPRKLSELQALWWQEAEKFGVLPLDPNRRARFVSAMNQSGPTGPVIRYRGPGVHHVPEALSPPVKRRSHEVVVRLAKPYQGEEGVLVAAGGKTGGYSLYLKNGYLNYSYNLYNERFFSVRSKEPVPPGVKEFGLRFEKDATALSGEATLLVGEDPVGSVHLPKTTLNSFSIEDPFDIGMDSASPVTPEYIAPFRYEGKIEEVIFKLAER